MLAEVIEYLYPNLRQPEGCMVALIDGREVIASWPGDLARPTEAELSAATGSDAFREWRTAKAGLAIDAQTGQLISRSIHTEAGIAEQIGILRDQIVQILNALGIEATPDFARLNEVAMKAITEARAKKEAL